jgi:glycosyltransferase involved in cell wall biosynthesis
MTAVKENTNRTISVLQLGNPTGMYGAERWILALVKHLDKAKIRSIVGVLRDDGSSEMPALARYAEGIGVESVVFDAPGRLSFSAVGQLRQFIKQNGISVLHTHGYKTDIIGRLATWGTSCQIVSTPHGWSQDAGLLLQFYEALDRLSFLFMDCVAPLSDELQRGLRKIPFLERKLLLIRNGVDISEVEDARQFAATGDNKDVGQTFRVGYIGQLINRKRIDTLIRAFAAVDIAAKELIIIGEGPQRTDYEVLAADLVPNDTIRFLGFRDDRIEHLIGFDVFVLPSELEGIPRCVMEAMAAGVAVVATDIPGCRDAIEHEVCGLLFDVGNEQQLSECLLKLAANPDFRRAMGEAGRIKVNEQFSAARMADEYAALFLELAGDNESERER